MKFVSELNDLSKLWLKEIENSPLESNRTRSRSQAVRLSDEGFKMKEIMKICGISHKTACRWIEQWEKWDFDSLLEAPRSGRPPTIPVEKEESVIKMIQKEPRQLKSVLEEISQEIGVKVSKKMLRRILKKRGFSWKRIRKSLRSKRNEEEFQQATQEIKLFLEAEKEELLDVFYFDESGFSLTPVVPYAWQEKENPLESPSSRSKQLNVLGFINKKNQFSPYVFEGSINSDIVIACFEDFNESLQRPAVVIIDNASIHTSNQFTEKIEEWEKKGLFVYNLPKYSPELNKN